MTTPNLEPDNLVFISLAVLFCAEQLFCFYLGSYPYLYGLTVKKIFLKNLNANSLVSKKLKIKKNKINNISYIHYKYPFGVFGPLIFIGIVKNIDKNIAEIKIGPLSLVFFAYIAVETVFLGNLMGFFNLIILGMLVLYIYYNFVREVRGLGESAG